MSRKFTLTVILFSISLSTGIFAQESLVPLGGEAGTPFLLIPAPEDARYAHLGWPKICVAGDGSVLIGCIAGRAHTVDGSVAIFRSEDDGKTFDKMQILKDFDRSMAYRHCGNIAMGTAPDGSVTVLAMAFTDNTRHAIFGWRSTDGGRNWSEVDTSTLSDNKTGSVFGEIFDVPGLGRIVFGHYRKPAKPIHEGIWFSVSKDAGRSWGEPRTVVAGNYYEPAFTFCDGKIVGLLRIGGSGSRAVDMAVSDDFGETWTITNDAISLPEDVKGSLPSPYITISRKNPKKLIAVQAERARRGDSRGALKLWTADVDSLEWTEKTTLVSIPKNAGNLADWSYPWMTPLADGNWLLVFYAGQVDGPCALWGLRFDPER